MSPQSLISQVIKVTTIYWLTMCPSLSEDSTHINTHLIFTASLWVRHNPGFIDVKTEIYGGWDHIANYWPSYVTPKSVLVNLYSSMNLMNTSLLTSERTSTIWGTGLNSPLTVTNFVALPWLWINKWQATTSTTLNSSYFVLFFKNQVIRLFISTVWPWLQTITTRHVVIICK